MSELEQTELLAVVKLVVIFSHGNAIVESGLSINGDILAENLKYDGLVGERLVNDAIRSAGGLIPAIDKLITHDLLKFVSSARSRYRAALEENKLKSENQRLCVNDQKRKLDIFKELEAKKPRNASEAALLDEPMANMRKQL